MSSQSRHTEPYRSRFVGRPIELVGGAKVYLELRPSLDFKRIIGQGKPNEVFRGGFPGFSLPNYAADEELFFQICVPDRWDGTTDILIHVYCYLDTANTDKNFKLQLSWAKATEGSAVPATLTDVDVTTATGTAAQYQMFTVSFTIDASGIAADDVLGLRLRRYAAAPNDIAGEVVIMHLGAIFYRDKLGLAA